MKNATQLITALAVSLVLTISAFAGSKGDHVQYIGGTIDGVKAGADGALDLTEKDCTTFTVKHSETTIPYGSVTSVEYGQKAGRRVGAAIGTAVLLGPIGLAVLASKKRKHIVTLSWTVDGHNQAAAFEFSKGDIRTALTVLEARTGKKIEYESEDARQNIGR